MPEMDTFNSLKDHFLIAMPNLADPNFSHTVTYLCAHTKEGAMGIVINKPLGLSLAEIASQLAIQATEGIDTLSIPLYDGGPVQREHGFVVHHPHGNWSSSLLVTDEIAVTTSRDILHAIAHGEGPEQYLIALGYAGWGEGQLEQEMADNAWLSVPADHQVIFELPDEQRWNAAAKRLGIDLNLLSGEVGHA